MMNFIILNIIASNAINGWKRPIYFTHPFGELGFGGYLRKDGLAYRLVPVAVKTPERNWLTDQILSQTPIGGTSIRDNNSDSIYKNLMTHYEFGGAGRKGMYYDEENRRHLLSIRSIFGEAAGNLADKGRIEDAQRLLDKAEKGISTESLPYAMTSRYNSHNQTAMIYLEACYKSGKTDLAEKVRVNLRKDLEDQKKYYDYIRTSRSDLFGHFERTEYPINEILLQVLDEIEKKYAPHVVPKTTTETPAIITNPPKDSVGADTGRDR